MVILLRSLFPAEIVVVVNGEAAILGLPLALFRLLFRVCREIVFRQVVGERHGGVSGLATCSAESEGWSLRSEFEILAPRHHVIWRLPHRVPRGRSLNNPRLHAHNMAPGERSEEVFLWYTTVYEAIQEIPHGKVTSYGHIARLVGKRERSLRLKEVGC
jgi:hypothetical protein